MKKILTFHGKQELKDKYVSRAIAHRKADEIVQGSYWNGTKGCCVGCLAHVEDYPHQALLDQIGLPLFITQLADRIHENLAYGEYQKWPERFIKSIPVGVDLSDVFPKMMIYVLKDCRKYAKPNSKKVINNVIKAFEAQLRGEVKSSDEWFELRRAAAACADAADAADAAVYVFYDAAAFAAVAAANANAAAVAYAAAVAVADAYAADIKWEMAKEKTMKKYSNKFIKLIKECN